MANNENWAHQLSIKTPTLLMNHRFENDEALKKFFGFNIMPTPEMMLGELYRLEKKVKELYSK